MILRRGEYMGLRGKYRIDQYAHSRAAWSSQCGSPDGICQLVRVGCAPSELRLSRMRSPSYPCWTEYQPTVVVTIDSATS